MSLTTAKGVEQVVVLEAPLQGNGKPPALICAVGVEDKLEEKLNLLPLHPAGFARIFDLDPRLPDDRRKELIRHIASVFPAWYKPAAMSNSVSDVDGLSSQ